MKPEPISSDDFDFSPRWHAMAAGLIAAALLIAYFSLKGLVLH